MGTRTKIQRLFNQKQQAEKEIKKLQDCCNHKESHLRFIYPNPLSQLTSLRWVCDECQVVLRIPTEKERKEWLKK